MVWSYFPTNFHDILLSLDNAIINEEHYYQKLWHSLHFLICSLFTCNSNSIIHNLFLEYEGSIKLWYHHGDSFNAQFRLIKVKVSYILHLTFHFLLSILMTNDLTNVSTEKHSYNPQLKLSCIQFSLSHILNMFCIKYWLDLISLY